MRLDAIFQGEMANISSNSEISDILGRLNVGDLVKARILEITSDVLILKLFDGTTFSAAAASDIDAKPGEYLDLIVKNKSDRQLVMETVKNENQKEKTGNEVSLKKLLIDLDIKPTEKNIGMAAALKANKLPLSKDAFQRVFDIVTRFKDLSPAKAAFLLGNNMSVEEKNISALNQMLETKNKIPVHLNELIEVLENIDDEVLKNKLAEGFLKLEDIKGQLKADIKPLPQQTVQQAVSAAPQKSDTAVKIQDIIKQELPAPAGKNSLPDTKILQLAEKLADIINKEFITPGDKFQKLEGLVRNELKNSLMLLPLSNTKADETIDSIMNRLKTSIVFSRDIDEVSYIVKANRSIPLEDENPKSIIHRALEKLFIKIDPSSSKENLDVKGLYKEIYSHLAVIKDGIEGSNLANKADVLNKLDGLQNNIRFLNEVNNNTVYVQVPLNILDKNTSGDLYILKRDSKRKGINPENVTMLISLNTANMGQVETLITVDKKSISLNLRVEEQSIIDFMKENYKKLYSRLGEIGYRLVDIRYKKLDMETNLLSINQVAEREAAPGRVSIDYRL